MRHLRSFLIVLITLAPLAEARTSMQQQHPAWGSTRDRARNASPRVNRNPRPTARPVVRHREDRFARRDRLHRDRLRREQVARERVRRGDVARRRARAERTRFARLLAEEMRRERALVARLADLDARLVDLRHRRAARRADLDAVLTEREALICEREEVLARKDELLARRGPRVRRNRRDDELARGARIVIGLLGGRTTPVRSHRFRRELERCERRLAAIANELCALETSERELQRDLRRLNRRAETLRCERETIVRDLGLCRTRCTGHRNQLTRWSRATR